MSMYHISYAIISGQKGSAEIVVSASTFLSKNWQYVTPICTEKSVRKELLSALNNYVLMDKVHNSEPAEYYVNRLVEPSKDICSNYFFCLALDLEGYAIAKDIFLANEKNPDEKVYNFVCNLNLLDRRISPPPTSILSIDYLSKIKNGLFYLSEDYDKLHTKETFFAYIKNRIPLTDNELEYYTWFKTLYEYILPWKNIVCKIQSVYS